MFPEDPPDECFQKSRLGFQVGMAPLAEGFSTCLCELDQVEWYF